MIKVNGFVLPVKEYPNGESRLECNSINDILKKENVINISLRYESDKDLMHLWFLKRHIEDTAEWGTDVNLIICYMPYSRMDRVENSGFAFTLKYIVEFINGLGFNNIYIWEPHSDVTKQLFDYEETMAIVKMIDITQIIFNKAIDDKKLECDIVCFPDKGAQKRYASMFPGYKHCYFDKKRDFNTGKITEMTYHGEENLNGAKVCIVDDLCSRGGTFVWAAEELRKHGASEVNLVVTHAENTIYDGNVFKGTINKVICTDSILTKIPVNSQNLIVYKNLEEEKNV